jgi:putative ABC transport system permease protein
VRSALGATADDMLRLTLARGLGLTLAGLAIGLPLALIATRALQALVFQVEPTDAPSFITAALLLALAGLAASFIPARRASRTDPAAVLRCE